MKTSCSLLKRVGSLSRNLLVMTGLLCVHGLPLRADGPLDPPLLEFTSGLPGQQVRLTWAGQTGVRYAIEKSTTLATGGTGGWSRVAMVEATGPEVAWLDPEPTSLKAFYRVSQSAIGVFSISPPLLSTTGGILILHGQLIPAGSFLVVQVAGEPPILVPLLSMGNGQWQAEVSGTFAVGSDVAVVGIQNGSGATLLTLNQPLTVTQTGFALDGPASLPPAAPMPQAQSNPISGIGIVIKRNHGKPHRVAPGGEDCDDRDIDRDYGATSLIAGFLTRKGYSAYQALANEVAGLQNNPTFSENPDAHGKMPDMAGLQVNPLHEETRFDINPLFQGSKRNYHKHPDLMKREIGPGATYPSPSGLPGEVSFQSCDISLPCPAGPPLAWISTYRSMAPVSSGHGPGWDFSYNIFIEPIPSTAGSTAARVAVHDGGGRTDIFHRQPDGSYRCDGMFREGRFTGDTFTLTFADTGTWTFKPLDASPAAGKVHAITDRNGVALTCAYDTTGLLETVSDAFGRSLAVEWSPSPPRIVSVTSTDSLSLNFTKIEFSYTSADEKRASASAPFVPGQTPVAGPTTYAYASGSTDPRSNDNLLSITDGHGRLMEAFTYSAESNPLHLDYDTCTSHDRHSMGTTGHSVLVTRETTTTGGYTIFEVDEIGRLTETDCDRQHRVVAVREFTGFCTPGVPVTSASNRPNPASMVRATDPPYFETTCAYNADSQCTRITYPDGSQELVTYDRDFRPNCPPREGGNPREISLVTPGGQRRTVSQSFEPGFGNPESDIPGNPIKGISVKGGRNPGGNIGSTDFASPGSPIKGISVKGGRNPGGNIGTQDFVAGGGDGRVDRYVDTDSDGFSALPGSPIKGISVKSGGRNPGGNIPSSDFASPGNPIGGLTIKGGRNHGSSMAARPGSEPNYLDLDADNDVIAELVMLYNARNAANFNPCIGECDFRTRMVNAHGQVTTAGYDEDGNCTFVNSPLPSRGVLYQHNDLGQLTSVTVLNGPGSSFQDEYTYDAATGFLNSVVCDSAGLHLTTSFERDPQGRITRMVDPLLNDSLYSYNPLNQCIQIQSPLLPGSAPYRISSTMTIDPGGRPARIDVEHRAPDGTLDAANPAYSTFHVYDARGRLVRVAVEERPVDASGQLEPDPLTLGSYAVCDITRDDAGQVSSIVVPAASRAQASDLIFMQTHDERGMVHRVIEGALGTPSSVTTECDYDLFGALVRCATVAVGVTSPETHITYDGFHRFSSVTDPDGTVTTFDYGNDGSVITSITGNVPGLPGPVLLSRVTSKSSYTPSPSVGGGFVPLDGARGRVKNQNSMELRMAFFDVEVEDDTYTVERFTPGSTAPPVNEVTIVDRSPAGLVQSVSRNGDLLLSVTHDSAGRPASITNSASTIAPTFDANGRILIITRTDHFRGAGAPPSETFTNTFVRDSLGRVTQRTDGVGNVWTAAYDSFDRCVSSTAPGRSPVLYAYDGSSTTGPYSQQISCDVNGTGSPVVLGSMLVRSGSLNTITDSFGHSIALSEDGMGRFVSSLYPDGTHETVTYNSLGFVSGQSYRDGTSVSIATDALGRVTEVAWPGNPVTYQYDGLGRCVAASQGTSTVAFVYDSLGNPVSETQSGMVSTPQVVTRTFNHRGRTGITYPGGSSFAEARDEFGNLLSISAVGAPPASPPVVVMDYVGQRVWRSTPANGVVTVHNYRSNGEASPAGGSDASFDACVSTTVSNSGGGVLSRSTTRRAPDQSVSQSETYFADGSSAPGRIMSFTRDNLARLTGCLTQVRLTSGGPVTTESEVAYTLDLEGRRISEVRNTVAGYYFQDNTLPPGDQQAGQYTIWPGGDLTWDDAGNLLTMQKGSSTLEFVHDIQGRMVACNQPGGAGLPPVPVAEFSYDALGRILVERIYQGASITETRFVHDGSTCIQEWADDGSGSGAFSPSLTMVGGGLKHCISTRNGTLYYPHGGGVSGLEREWTAVIGMACTSGKDGAAHVNLITDATAQPLERIACDDACKPIFLDASGAVRSGATSTVGPLKWMAPEARWIPETGMFHGAGNVYSPDLGTVVAKEKEKPKKKDYFKWDLAVGKGA